MLMKDQTNIINPPVPFLFRKNYTFCFKSFPHTANHIVPIEPQINAVKKFVKGDIFHKNALLNDAMETTISRKR